MIKKISVILTLAFFTLFLSAYKKPDVYVIDAEKNAISHNNMGLQYVAEHNYYGAIQEFALAIMLNPKTQATAIYYNNLGETYMKVNLYKNAQECFEKALNQYSLNFLYYQNLVKSFSAQKIIGTKIKQYQAIENKNSLNMVMLGLLYAQNGEIGRAIIKLDEFTMKEPDLLITPAVRNYITELVRENP